MIKLYFTIFIFSFLAFNQDIFAAKAPDILAINDESKEYLYLLRGDACSPYDSVLRKEAKEKSWSIFDDEKVFRKLFTMNERNRKPSAYEQIIKAKEKYRSMINERDKKLSSYKEIKYGTKKYKSLVTLKARNTPNCCNPPPGEPWCN